MMQTSIAVSGDLAYPSGSFQVTYTDEQTTKVKNDSGTYVTVFRKQTEGSWKAVPGGKRALVSLPPAAALASTGTPCGKLI